MPRARGQKVVDGVFWWLLGRELEVPGSFAIKAASVVQVVVAVVAATFEAHASPRVAVSWVGVSSPVFEVVPGGW
jgi:hypothetical protein